MHLQNLSWNFLNQLGVSVTGMVVYFVSTAYLEPADFGVMVTMVAVTQFMAAVIISLFESRMTQRATPYEDELPTLFSLIISLSAIGAMASIAIIHLMHDVWQDAYLRLMMFVACVDILLTALVAPYNVLFRRESRFRDLAVISLAARLTGCAVGLYIILAGYGSVGLILQNTLSNLIAIALMILVTKRLVRPGWNPDIALDYLHFGTPVIFRTLQFQAFLRLTSIFAKVIGGDTAAGYVGFSQRLVDMLTQTTRGAMNGFILPLMARQQHDVQAIRQTYLHWNRGSVFIIAPLFAGLAMVAEPVTLLIGEQWLPAAPFLQLFSIAAMISASFGLSYMLYIAVGNPGKMLWAGVGIYILSLLVMFSGSWFGLIMIPIAHVFRFVLGAAVSLFGVKQEVGLPLRQQLAAFAAYFPSLLMMTALWALQSLDFFDFDEPFGLLAMIVSGALIYALAASPFHRRIHRWLRHSNSG